MGQANAMQTTQCRADKSLRGNYIFLAITTGLHDITQVLVWLMLCVLGSSGTKDIISTVMGIER